MQRGIKYCDIEPCRPQRHVIERGIDAFEQVCRVSQKFCRYAEPVYGIVADVERDSFVSHTCDAIAEPTIARAQVENVQRSAKRPRHRCHNMLCEDIEAARTHRPLLGEWSGLQIGQCV